MNSHLNFGLLSQKRNVFIVTFPSTFWTPLLRRVSLFLITLAIAVSTLQQSYAQTVQPMTFQLEPLGSKSSESLRIENKNSGPVTLEIVPLKIILDELGNETHLPAEDDFLIYPPQTIIQADSTQLVKVKYIGDPTINSSQAYRISVNQLPVNLTADATGVSILTKFLTMVNVVPKKARPDLKVIDVKADENEGWLVTVENSGNRYGTLSNTSWELESTSTPSKTKEVSAEEIESILSKNFILPNSILRISIPAFDGFEAASTKIKMKKQKT